MTRAQLSRYLGRRYPLKYSRLHLAYYIGIMEASGWN